MKKKGTNSSSGKSRIRNNYRHKCDRCTLLGQFREEVSGKSKSLDLYCCHQDWAECFLILRYGNWPWEHETHSVKGVNDTVKCGRPLWSSYPESLIEAYKLYKEKAKENQNETVRHNKSRGKHTIRPKGRGIQNQKSGIPARPLPPEKRSAPPSPKRDVVENQPKRDHSDEILQKGI